nr:immunoglobulin heavy chain junction region [Mus musculus]
CTREHYYAMDYW